MDKHARKPSREEQRTQVFPDAREFANREAGAGAKKDEPQNPRTANLGETCEHGQLLRQCPHCDAEYQEEILCREIHQLRAQLASRCDQVEELQQALDEVCVAVGPGTLPGHIVEKVTRLRAEIESLKAENDEMSARLEFAAGRGKDFATSDECIAWLGEDEERVIAGLRAENAELRGEVSMLAEELGGPVETDQALACLGERLADQLGADHWNNVEPYLNGAVAAFRTERERAERAEAERDEARALAWEQAEWTEAARRSAMCGSLGMMLAAHRVVAAESLARELAEALRGLLAGFGNTLRIVNTIDARAALARYDKEVGK